MSNELAVETLRQWLVEHRPIAVLDIRTKDDRAQWWIPGSTHVDAYDALRKGEPGALATLSPPMGQPIVTVCGAGRLSRTAADLLSARGLDAYSLTGGMKAWSLAWNAADVRLPEARTRVVQVRRTGKGCLSYVIGSGSDAAVIDADDLKRQLKGNPFRTFIHKPALMERLIGDAGFTLFSRRRTWIWSVDVFARD